MTNKIKNYRERIEACWLGKAIAGGVGAPYEGVPYALALTEQDVHIDDSPNDDLELQLLWLLFAEKHGLQLESKHFIDAWANHIKYGADEYGVAIWNLKRGLMPPYTGLVDNWFTDGLGAAIRAEIWACLYPGNPQAAGYFAGQDASVDHHNEGVWAAIYLAASESIAFEVNDVKAALQGGLEHIPSDSRIAQVVNYIFELYTAKLPYSELRALIIKRFGSHNFTDCVMNLGFIVAALLFGENDFIRTTLYAVNFGKDTDCTAATCGAFLGIALGMDVIPEDLRNKLCSDISVSPFMETIPGLPRTFDAFTKRVVELGEKLSSEVTEQTSFPVYVPAKASDVPCPTHNSWLVVSEQDDMDMEQLEKTLLETRECPEHLKSEVAEFNSINLDLSEYAENFNWLHLFSFMTFQELCDNPLVMICANTGITAWINGIQVLNYHGRQKEIPALHRTEGGGAFYHPLKAGEKYLVHVRLLFCRKPLKFSAAVGNDQSQFLKDFEFRI